jgi:hypothetical protein
MSRHRRTPIDGPGQPPDDPSHLSDWLMVRGIRRRLVAGA